MATAALVCGLEADGSSCKMNYHNHIKEAKK
jgi:hypothetical protein